MALSWTSRILVSAVCGERCKCCQDVGHKRPPGQCGYHKSALAAAQNANGEHLRYSQHEFPDAKGRNSTFHCACAEHCRAHGYDYRQDRHPTVVRDWRHRQPDHDEDMALQANARDELLGNLHRAIAVVHYIFIWLHLFLELHLAWDVKTVNYPYVCEVFNVLYITPQYLAPLLILGFTTERYIAVCLPFKKETYCTVRRACILVLMLTVLSLVLGSVQAYIWTYHFERDLCFFRPGARPFYVVWTWISEILIFAVVPLVVLVFNILVIHEIRLLTRRASLRLHRDSCMLGASNKTSTVTLLAVSFYLICTLLPATIVYTMQSVIRAGDPSIRVEDWTSDPQWQLYLTYFTVRKIVEEICFSNYACYIFIYYITGSYFRKEVHKLLLCRKEPSRQSGASRSSRGQEQYTLVTTNGKHELTEPL